MERNERIMGPWAYVGLRILYAIPVIGFIFLIIFTFSSGNINRRNFTRSYWCGLLIWVIIIAALFVLIYYTEVLDPIKEPLAQYFKDEGKSGEIIAEFLVPGITADEGHIENNIPDSDTVGPEMVIQEADIHTAAGTQKK